MQAPAIHILNGEILQPNRFKQSRRMHAHEHRLRKNKIYYWYSRFDVTDPKNKNHPAPSYPLLRAFAAAESLSTCASMQL